MARRRGASRGTGSRRTTLLDAIVNAVVDETTPRTKRAPRREAQQESRLPRDGGGTPNIGAVRLGLRREGEQYTDFAGDAFRGELSNDDAASAVQDVIARRMRALGLDPVADMEPVDPNAEAAAMVSRAQWELRISGTHAPSGLSNQRILEIRASEGRDFAQDTEALRDHALSAVRAGIGATWDDDRAMRLFADAVLAWIVRRLDEQGVDIDLAPLSPAYRAQKLAAGLDGRIGIATGAWRRALARAEVVVTA